MSDAYKFFPRGQVGIGAGDLKQCENAKFDFKRNAKQKSTLAKPQAGYVFGNPEFTGSFDIIIDQDGPERDWIQKVKDGDLIQARFKAPTLTTGATILLDGVSCEFPVDDAIKYTVTFIGKMND